jgi:hypothetical protein
MDELEVCVTGAPCLVDIRPRAFRVGCSNGLPAGCIII